MKRLCVLVALTFITGTTYLIAADRPAVTLEGTLVSSACYTGSPDHPTTNDMGEKKQCGTYCLRKGDPAGLVTKSGEFHVLIVSSLKLATYVGQQVRVTGADFNGAVSVDKVEVSKDGNWQQINLKTKS